jgi:hypothetical protein
MAPNPLTFTLPARAQIFISCVANAAFTQRVTINVPNLQPAVFQGTGENVTLLLTDGSGDTFDVDAASVDRSCTITFDYSSGGPFQHAVVQDPQTRIKPLLQITTISSEDGGGVDNNDSILTIAAMFPPLLPTSN